MATIQTVKRFDEQEKKNPLNDDVVKYKLNLTIQQTV
jgi:hypothetical protein